VTAAFYVSIETKNKAGIAQNAGRAVAALFF
jgi:hypothetical protein